MEGNSFEISKLTSNPTETSWAQSYSAGRLYIAMSIQGKENVALLGKDLLEKLQREFFALDKKTLSTVKKSIESAISSLDDDIKISLTLCTIVENVLYILILNSGYVILKRSENTSIIANGEENAITTYSGEIKNNDIFILLTGSFLDTINLNEFKNNNYSSITDINESLAPILHEKSTGLEANLVIKISNKNFTASTNEEVPEEESNKVEKSIKEERKKINFSFPTINISKRFNKNILTSFTKRHIIILIVIVLVTILGLSIFMEHNKREENTLNKKAEQILENNKKKFEDAAAIMSLNKGLAVEELEKVKADTELQLNSFPKGSKARTMLEELIKNINLKLGNSSSGNSKITIFVDSSKNTELKSIKKLTNKGGSIVISGEDKIAILSNNGTVEKKIDASAVKGISANEKTIYLLTENSVSKVDKSLESLNKIFDVKGKSIDSFGDNIYVLEGKSINKYRPNSYSKEPYLLENQTLNNPSSIAIDSSIYVIDESKIKKFTRGKEESINFKGPSLSSVSIIYTDENYKNLYVVDISSKTAYVFDKEGNKISEVSLKGMKNITGISANEKEQKMFVVADNKIYQIHL